MTMFLFFLHTFPWSEWRQCCVGWKQMLGIRSVWGLHKKSCFFDWFGTFICCGINVMDLLSTMEWMFKKYHEGIYPLEWFQFLFTLSCPFGKCNENALSRHDLQRQMFLQIRHFSSCEIALMAKSLIRSHRH